MTKRHPDNVIFTEMTCLRCDAPIQSYSKDMAVLGGNICLMAIEMNDHLKSGCEYPFNQKEEVKR